MGFFFTLLYTAVSLLSPADLFPSLAPYRIMIWLAALAVLASFPKFFSPRWLKSPHIFLMIGFMISMGLSRLFNGWVGGPVSAVIEFLPSALIFFLLLWNVTSVNHVRILSIVLLLAAVYAVGRGMIGYHMTNIFDPYTEFQPQRVDDAAEAEKLGLMESGGRYGFLRIRSLGVLNDPNDFAQYLLIMLPLLLPFWKKGEWAGNLFKCWLPAGMLLYGMYLTSSRGGLLGLLVLLLFFLASRLTLKRIVLLTPLLAGCVLLATAAGRGISVNEDSAQGRINAWSDGIGMFKSSPLWGVGYGQFTAFHERTAHNSFVLSLSELGLLGTFFWVGLIYVCVRYLRWFRLEHEAGSDAARWAFAVQASLWTTLVTSWFLSRTYSPTLYLILGMAAALSLVETGEEPAAEAGPDPEVLVQIVKIET